MKKDGDHFHKDAQRRYNENHTRDAHPEGFPNHTHISGNAYYDHNRARRYATYDAAASDIYDYTDPNIVGL